MSYDTSNCKSDRVVIPNDWSTEHSRRDNHHLSGELCVTRRGAFVKTQVRGHQTETSMARGYMRCKQINNQKAPSDKGCFAVTNQYCTVCSLPLEKIKQRLFFCFHSIIVHHSAVSVGFYFCQTPPLGKLDPALSAVFHQYDKNATNMLFQ